MRKSFPLLLALFLFAAGGPVAQKTDVASELHSLVETEQAFSRASEAKGMREAFLSYLADDAVIFRPQPVNGKQWTREHPSPAGVLAWRPIFADVSAAGDLGYTTGPWVFRRHGSDDKRASHGNFVSVWKKQPDGTWKVVLDTGISNPPPTSADAGALQLPATDRVNAAGTGARPNIESERASLLKLDRELAHGSVTQATVDAFLANVTDDARFFRMNMQPLTEKKAIHAALSEKTGLVTWQPTKAEVSRSADLGYVYGTYEFRDQGATPSESGNYVRVWKRQPDGAWKVVLEILNPIPRG